MLYKFPNNLPNIAIYDSKTLSTTYQNSKTVATTMLYLSALICFHIQLKSLFTAMLKRHQTPQTLWFQGVSEPFYFPFDSKTTVSTCKETIILININSRIFIQLGNRTYWELTLSAIKEHIDNYEPPNPSIKRFDNRTSLSTISISQGSYV